MLILKQKASVQYGLAFKLFRFLSSNLLNACQEVHNKQAWNGCDSTSFA